EVAKRSERVRHAGASPASPACTGSAAVCAGPAVAGEHVGSRPLARAMVESKATRRAIGRASRRQNAKAPARALRLERGPPSSRVAARVAAGRSPTLSDLPYGASTQVVRRPFGFCVQVSTESFWSIEFGLLIRTWSGVSASIGPK